MSNKELARFIVAVIGEFLAEQQELAKDPQEVALWVDHLIQSGRLKFEQDAHGNPDVIRGEY